MQHINGSSTEEKLVSIDGILAGILRKQILMHNSLNKKHKEPFSFNISGYARECIQGEIVCAYFSLMTADIKKAVIIIDEFPEKDMLFADVKILSDTGVERNTRVPIKKGINSVEDIGRIEPGDRLSISLDYKEIKPYGIWVALRGERV